MKGLDPLQNFRQQLALSVLIIVTAFAPLSAYLEFSHGSIIIGWLSVSIIFLFPLFIYLYIAHQKRKLALYTVIFIVSLIFFIGIPDKITTNANMVWIPLIPIVLYSLGGLRLGNLFSAAGLIYLVSLFAYYSDINVINFTQNLDVIVAYLFAVFLGFAFEKHHGREQQGSHQQANTDPLTGISNRRGMDEVWSNITNENLPETCIGFMLIDLDNFKEINDKFGHATGDAVLVEISQLLAGLLRGHDHMSRWGGEEFAIMLPGINRDQAESIAERIRQSVEMHQFTNVEKLTCSIGITCGSSNTELNQLVEKADKALYKAKQLGKNNIAIEQE